MNRDFLSKLERQSVTAEAEYRRGLAQQFHPGMSVSVDGNGSAPIVGTVQLEGKPGDVARTDWDARPGYLSVKCQASGILYRVHWRRVTPLYAPVVG
jgi:hypothetical protein